MEDTRTLVAEELYRALVTDTRTNGETFIKLVDGHPDWMTDVMHEAHGDMLPDDWRYKMIDEVLGDLLEYDPDNWEDRSSEICDGLVDVYNSDRMKWLNSHHSRASYVDEARDEGLIGRDADLMDQLGSGQYREYEEILHSLVRSITERAEELDDEESVLEDEAKEAGFEIYKLGTTWHVAKPAGVESTNVAVTSDYSATVEKIVPNGGVYTGKTRLEALQAWKEAEE